ncbi:MAG: LuxR C-terminal-related transcriptional regulator [bacterium]|nr:LuxR C-terminal-related transcriptional regulator [bacterium]
MTENKEIFQVKKNVMEKDFDTKNFNLTKQEMNVLRLLVRGFSNKEIADELCVSFHTSKAHLESIYEKMGTLNRLQTSIKAVYYGLVNLSEAIEFSKKRDENEEF